jgi:hypothetical protein
MVEKKIRPKFPLFDQAASFGLRNLIKSQADFFQNYIIKIKAFIVTFKMTDDLDLVSSSEPNSLSRQG